MSLLPFHSHWQDRYSQKCPHVRLFGTLLGRATGRRVVFEGPGDPSTAKVRDRLDLSSKGLQPMWLKSALILCLAVSGISTSTALGQIYGTYQSNLKPPGAATWNYRVAFMHDYAASKVRLWWSCGPNNQPAICYGEKSGITVVYVGTDIVASSFGLCDLSDPTVVKFNGQYYLYGTGIENGNPGCPQLTPPGVNGKIFGFVSSNARNWTILNGGQPVITMPNSGTFGIGQPSAVVMNYAYSCNGSTWVATPTTPRIRIYHTQSANKPPTETQYNLFAKNSTNGVTFTAHTDALGKQAILRGSGVQFNGFWPEVKKVGIFGDYPLVISYSGPNGGEFTAVTGNKPSDFNWMAGNAGLPLNFVPSSSTSASLEGIADGTFINSNGSQFFGAPSGSVGFFWSQNDTQIYRGYSTTSIYFPWSTSMGACP